MVVGPSDWEAEGRVVARELVAGPFRIDAREVAIGELRCGACLERFRREIEAGDLARAAYGITFDEAREHCAQSGGRLPRESEWIIAASRGVRRYPWGDSGAVCRRAAYGLVDGPCGQGARGPDTVLAHPDGRTPDGLFDLAGNVAEWVVGDVGEGPRAKGGSFRSTLAAELRVWAQLALEGGSRDDRLGFRCVEDVAPPRP
jgi:formylglycine-generating enzyme required for sulfatase activity